WGAVPERAVGPHLVVVGPPDLDLRARVREVDEPVLVQALVSKLPVEGLDEGVVDGFAGPDEVELDATAVRPGIERGAGKLGAVVDDDPPGQRAARGQAVKDAGDPEAGEPVVDLDGQALAARVVDDVQGAKGPAAGQAVDHEGQRPAAVRLGRGGKDDAGAGDQLAPFPPAHGELFFAIDAVDPFVVAVPSGTLQ